MFKTVFTTTAVAVALAAGSAMAHEWDSNDDGYVDAEEFRAGMAADEVIHTFDTNDDNMLDADEYNTMLFTVYDVDEDDQLTEDELTALTPFQSDAVRTGFDEEKGN